MGQTRRLDWFTIRSEIDIDIDIDRSRIMLFTIPWYERERERDYFSQKTSHRSLLKAMIMDLTVKDS